MRLNKEKLKEIIKEALDESEKDLTKIKSGSMSKSARARSARERIVSDTDEFTNQEQNVIEQLEAFISKLAAEPGVDLVKFRPLLQRVLRMLQQQAARSIKQPQQGEQK